MMKILIRLLSFIICLGIIAVGAYLSYSQSDLGAIKNDFDSAWSMPWFPQSGQ